MAPVFKVAALLTLGCSDAFAPTKAAAAVTRSMELDAVSAATAAKKRTASPVFPFTAVIGQEDMKLALQLNVIDPKIGGVLIMGERGTGKSTTIRAMTNLLPDIAVVKGCPFGSNPNNAAEQSEEVRQQVARGEALEIDYAQVPMVDLPLGATEDRVCGTIDIEKALTLGEKAFEPGLLAKANRGFLYVDEVNLLDDHLVDILLDSAASGVNTVEREGISIRHPARFVLVGSGNPEEGELRPQLLDRFGMYTEVTTVKDPKLRVQIVEERTAFDRDPEAWIEKYAEAEAAMQAKLDGAKVLLEKTTIEMDYRVKIAQICSELGVDGLRGDLVVNRCAKAYAAWNGRTEVTVKDIQAIVGPCLAHRLRKDPLETIDSGKKVTEAFDRVFLDDL
ncbi:magnesium chelatase subunit [Pelagophyceae sp. CCMP2097]|nr:magnesium chelatase subunit [Pelagophyceae sp. CCMP2097]|mmetsp:Transcript_18321/g.65187  ORF Transcript_18321/g.65187 Transcript_18321/m.65187 type:complete len:392 (-) Transcript_18321:188-1363(-)|eukprot:CAMPEP_0184082188 /NCGR_PEP_ID=MMETSP0974-20121125/3081_1 /TAXON_ID=483370 /ORGANISM="non described non described, Strain CCMP2097" /LENGTH=391 /DNA_ID=CAMNT_0026384863 /DNA_START=38 /DNA_END=1213 /DNA_ORIENTATION=-